MRKELSKVSCGFTSCFIKRFIFSLAESKTGYSKIGSIFLLALRQTEGNLKGQAKTNIPMDFMLNKNDRRREKNNNTRKTSWTLAQGHKLSALMKKRKEEILRNKEQSTEQLQNSPSVQSKEQSTGQSTGQSMVQPSVKSNDTYVYGLGILAVLAIDVCVFFAYNASQAKKRKPVNEKQDQQPKRRPILWKKSL